MSDLHQRLASAEQTIRELEKLTKWPPEEERYLYGEKPDVCLYRQMPESFTYNEHVSKHADHLTRENLREKWELCMELGWRDFQIERLRAALLSSPCPYPVGDHDGSTSQCIKRGECGCDNAVALRSQEAESDDN